MGIPARLAERCLEEERVRPAVVEVVAAVAAAAAVAGDQEGF